MKVKQFIRILRKLPADAPLILIDEQRHSAWEDEENHAGVYDEFTAVQLDLTKTGTDEIVQGVAINFQNKFFAAEEERIGLLMRCKELFLKLQPFLEVKHGKEPAMYADEGLADEVSEIISEITENIEP